MLSFTASAPFSCRPVRLAVAELYAPATGRLVFPSFRLLLYTNVSIKSRGNIAQIY
nr:MAG TPA: hypothetical protein [Caudoviricetes sp.]